MRHKSISPLKSVKSPPLLAMMAILAILAMQGAGKFGSGSFCLETCNRAQLVLEVSSRAEGSSLVPKALKIFGLYRLRKNGVSAVGLYQGMASAVPQSV